MSKKPSKPQNRKKKTTHGGMKIRGRARVRVKGDVVGGDKIVQGDEINAGGDANVANIGADAIVGDIIFDGKRKPKPEELAAAKRAYLEFVIRANQDVKPSSVIDAQNRVTLQLDEIYVPVTITFKEIRAETDKKDKRDKSQEEPPKRIELPQIVRDSPRAVLLGEPGAGKTTILRYLALHFAKTLREHPDYGVNVRHGDTDFGAARLPIFIRLATFASAKRTWREYILDAFSDVSAPKEAVEQVLTEATSQGKALILLDGLDEVLDDRAHVIDQIESFDAGLQGRNQIIVTSRRSSYGRALGGAFKAFDLNELEQEQIAKFLMCWNLAIEKKRIQENGETFQTEQEYEQAGKERAQEQFTKIAEKIDTNLGAQNLAKNPLTLRMLAEAYRWSGDLPNRRVDLYNLIVKQSLEFWETQVAQIPKGRNVSRREAITRLAPLAYWMHLENESPSEDQITKRLGEILALKLKLEPAHPDVENAVEDFWTRAKERTGLFVQDTPSHYGFVHATFREYFAGLYLVHDRAQAAQRIYAHRHQPRWEEPILLGIAHTSTDDPKFASELIRTAILAEGEEAARLGFEASRYEDVLHRDLLFAAQLVSDNVMVGQELADRIVAELSMGLLASHSFWPLHLDYIDVLNKVATSQYGRIAAEHLRKLSAKFLELECEHWIEPLAQIYDPKTAELLVRVVRTTENAEIRGLAFSGLWLMGAKADAMRLFSDLQDSLPVEYTYITAWGLARVGETLQAWDLLIKYLHDNAVPSDLYVEQNLVKLAGRLKDKEKATRTLFELARTTKDEGTRSLVIETLNQLGEKDLAAQLLQQISQSENDKFIRWQALDVMMEMFDGSEDAIDALVELAYVARDESGVGWRVAILLGRVVNKSDTVLNALRHLAYYSTDDLARQHAAEVLGQLGEKTESLRLLLDLADHAKEDYVRWRAAIALKSLGEQSRAVSLLTDLVVTTRDSDLWEPTVKALGEWGEIQALVKIAQTAGVSLRILAAKELGRLNEKKLASQILLEITKANADWMLQFSRRSAIEALGELGDNSKEVTEPLLRIASSHGSQDLLLPVAKALANLGEESEIVSERLFEFARTEKYNYVGDKDYNYGGRNFLYDVAKTLTELDAKSLAVELILQELPKVHPNNYNEGYYSRAGLARLLAELNVQTPEVLSALINATRQDFDKHVRHQAYDSLKQLLRQEEPTEPKMDIGA